MKAERRAHPELHGGEALHLWGHTKRELECRRQQEDGVGPKPVGSCRCRSQGITEEETPTAVNGIRGKGMCSDGSGGCAVADVPVPASPRHHPCVIKDPLAPSREEW